MDIPIIIDHETGCITPSLDDLWKQTNGPIPEGKTLRRSCKNNSCLNVLHLELQDPVPARKLTADDAKQIRKAYREAENKHGLQKKFAERYGVSPSTIRRLLKGYNYKDVD